MLELDEFKLSLQSRDLILTSLLYRLHLLLHLSAHLPQVLILRQERHSLLLGNLTAFLRCDLRFLHGLHLRAHPPHNLLFDLSDVGLYDEAILAGAHIASVPMIIASDCEDGLRMMVTWIEACAAHFKVQSLISPVRRRDDLHHIHVVRVQAALIPVTLGGSRNLGTKRIAMQIQWLRHVSSGRAGPIIKGL